MELWYQIGKWLVLEDYLKLRQLCKKTSYLDKIPSLSFSSYAESFERCKNSTNILCKLDQGFIGRHSTKYLVKMGHAWEFIRIMRTYAHRVSSLTKFEAFTHLIYSNQECNCKLEDANIMMMKELVNNRFGVDTFLTSTSIVADPFILHQACSKGYIDLVQAIVRKNPGLLNKKNTIGLTPLCIAIRCMKVEVASYIINECPELDLNVSNSTGWHPIHHASRVGLTEIVELLLKNPNVHPNISDNSGQSSILIAATFGMVGILQLLINDNRISDITKKTAIALSRSKGHHYFANKFENNISNGIENLDLLHFAAIKGRIYDFLRIIQKCKDINKPDSNGNTALHHAIRSGNYLIAKILIDHDDINLQVANKKGEKAIHFAAKFGRLSTMKNILSKPQSCNPEELVSKRRAPLQFRRDTPIVIAARYLRDTIVKELLKDSRISRSSKKKAKRAALRGLMVHLWHASEEEINDEIWDGIQDTFYTIWDLLNSSLNSR